MPGSRMPGSRGPRKPEVPEVSEVPASEPRWGPGILEWL